MSVGGGVVLGDHVFDFLAGDAEVEPQDLVEVFDLGGGDGVVFVDVAVEYGGEVVLGWLAAILEPLFQLCAGVGVVGHGG